MVQPVTLSIEPLIYKLTEGCSVEVWSYGTDSVEFRKKEKTSVIKTSQLMLYREIFAVCSEIHTKYINTLCGQNVELLNVKLVVHIVTTGL